MTLSNITTAELLAELVKRTEGKGQAQEITTIIAVTASAHETTPDRITNGCRDKNDSWARCSIVTFLSHKFPDMTNHSIGSLVGIMNPSSVVAARKRLLELIATSDLFALRHHKAAAKLKPLLG